MQMLRYISMSVRESGVLAQKKPLTKQDTACTCAGSQACDLDSPHDGLVDSAPSRRLLLSHAADDAIHLVEAKTRPLGRDPLDPRHHLLGVPRGARADTRGDGPDLPVGARVGDGQPAAQVQHDDAERPDVPQRAPAGLGVLHELGRDVYARGWDLSAPTAIGARKSWPYKGTL